ncbi:MAG: hypothetical protein DRG59_03665 [Deltaproteobacteria bacterium]|nr:MAG: hypothetical protein DRG59_03665 [Deltaproteobacteria bacterium]
MPKGYTQLVIYLKDEEEREKIKQFCEKAGIPVSVLVREFFRSLLRGQGNSIVINSGNKVEIGEININLTQHNNVQINNNIIAYITTKLEKSIEILKAALSKKSPLIMSQSIFLAKKELEEMLENIELLSPRGH